MMMGRWLLQLYASEQHAPERAFVDEHPSHCDDIAVNFIYANATGLPPLLFMAGFEDIAWAHNAGNVGLSTATPDWQKLREDCVARLTARFGRMPLVATSLAASQLRPSRAGWWRGG